MRKYAVTLLMLSLGLGINAAGAEDKDKDKDKKVAADKQTVVSPRDQATGQASGKRQHKPLPADDASTDKSAQKSSSEAKK